MFKKYLCALSGLLISISVCGTISAKVIDKTVAMVNGEPIMYSEYEEIIVPVLEQFKMSVPAEEQTPEKINELKNRVVEQMINDRILRQVAKKRKIRIAKREIEDGVKKVRERFPSKKDFAEELKKSGLTVKKFENRIKEQLMVMKLMDQEIRAKTPQPTDREIKSYYDKIQKKMEGKNLGLDKKDEEELASLAKLFKRAGAAKVRARHILISLDKNASMKDKAVASKKIKNIKSESRKGADFSDLAAKYSQDPTTKNNGGDVGFFAYDDMVPAFAKVAFATKVGSVSNPVLTDFGYHLIKVEEKRAAQKITYKDVRNDVKDYLFQKKAQEGYEKWIKRLRAKANIKVNSVD